MASCGGTLVKLLLAFFNLIWLVSGSWIAVVRRPTHPRPSFQCIGVFIIYLGYRTFDYSSEDIKELINVNFRTGALVLIGIGVGVLLIAAIGFLGACCESSALLNFYGLVMFLLLVGNIALVYYGYKYRDELNEKFSEGIKRGINKFRDDPKIAFALQNIQLTFECCGWDGPDDYRLGGGQVPASCCKEVVKMTNATATCSRYSGDVFQHGCRRSPVIEKYFGHITYSAYALDRKSVV